MAIVANRAGHGVIDKPLTTHNRTVTAEPNGVTTPQFAGEIVLDTANNMYWKAVTLLNTGWIALTPPA